jgi:chemotaxis regulatin CheY-phosphate phosphatase CheZ
MDVAQVRALASELETTLGLLSELIGELQRTRQDWPSSGRVQELVARLADRSDLAELPTVLLRAHAGITEVLGGIRLTREAIEAHAVERIRETHDRLSDVTTTTESATLELMNGLDRSIELVNSLEQQANGKASAQGFQQLRDQVSALYNHLQFQDITAQQLQGVTHSLLDLEVRVAAVASLFDQNATEVVHAESLRRVLDQGSSANLAFNPDATMKRTVADQSMVDEAFKGARHGHADTPGSPFGR